MEDHDEQSSQMKRANHRIKLKETNIEIESKSKDFKTREQLLDIRSLGLIIGGMRKVANVMNTVSSLSFDDFNKGSDCLFMSQNPF
eukprot:gene34054-44002_t